MLELACFCRLQVILPFKSGFATLGQISHIFAV
jgi:transcriptional antiterminator Rof (Rho-off)